MAHFLDLVGGRGLRMKHRVPATLSVHPRWTAIACFISYNIPYNFFVCGIWMFPGIYTQKFPKFPLGAIYSIWMPIYFHWPTGSSNTFSFPLTSTCTRQSLEHPSLRHKVSKLMVFKSRFKTNNYMNKLQNRIYHILIL